MNKYLSAEQMYREWYKEMQGIDPSPLLSSDKDVITLMKAYASQLIPSNEDAEISEGLRLIAEERQRQIEKEGWNKNHDAEHGNMELAGAAACYIANAINKHYAKDIKDWHEKARFQYYREPELNFLVNDGDRGDRKLNKGGWADGWPFDDNDDKRSKHDKLRSLVIAGALISAEIDRIKTASTTL